MPSERVSDGILFDGDISAAALSACCHLAVFLPGYIRFYCCNSVEGGTGDLSSIRRQWWVVWSSIGIRRYFECRLFSEESPNV